MAKALLLLTRRLLLMRLALAMTLVVVAAGMALAWMSLMRFGA
jgi:hypothetical protein